MPLVEPGPEPGTGQTGAVDVETRSSRRAVGVPTVAPVNGCDPTEGRIGSSDHEGDPR